MTQPMTRSNAVLTTQLTRAAAVVLGVGAVALGMTGLADRSIPAEGSSVSGPGVPPGLPPMNTGRAGETGGLGGGVGVKPVSFGPVDAEGLATRFAMLDNAPKIPDAKGVIVTTETGPGIVVAQESPAASAIVDRVRFLGVVRLGDRDAAFVNVDGRQRFVQEGARLAPPADRPEFPELVVGRITATAIVVGDGTAHERLSLAARTGPSVTMADGGIVNRVEIPADEPTSNMRQLPQQEIDRRARVMERQRSGTLNERGSRLPETVRANTDMRSRGARTPAAENADE